MGDRLVMLEDDIFNLSEAIDYLNRVSGCEDVVGALEDRLKVLSVDRERMYAEAAAEARREEDALRREYHRAVL